MSKDVSPYCSSLIALFHRQNEIVVRLSARDDFDCDVRIAGADPHAERAELVTLYTGADISGTEAETVRARIEKQFPNVAVEIVAGGQPHYDFIVSVE